MKLNVSAKIASLELVTSDIGFTREEMKDFLEEAFADDFEEFAEILDEDGLEKSLSIESAMSFNYMLSKEKVLIYGPPLKVLALAQGFVMAMQNIIDEGTA